MSVATSSSVTFEATCHDHPANECSWLFHDRDIVGALCRRDGGRGGVTRLAGRDGLAVHGVASGAGIDELPLHLDTSPCWRRTSGMNWLTPCRVLISVHCCTGFGGAPNCFSASVSFAISASSASMRVRLSASSAIAPWLFASAISSAVWALRDLDETLREHLFADLAEALS